METHKHYQLANRLEQLSVKGKLEWEATSRDESYQVAFSDYLIRFFVDCVGDDYHQTSLYAFEVLDQHGEVIDRFTEHDLGHDWSLRLSKLHTLIRRRIRGADQAIDKILGELEKIEPSPPPPEDDIPF